MKLERMNELRDADSQSSDRLSNRESFERKVKGKNLKTAESIYFCLDISLPPFVDG